MTKPVKTRTADATIVDLTKGSRWIHRKTKRSAHIISGQTERDPGTDVGYRYDVPDTSARVLRQTKPFVSTCWVKPDRFLKAFKPAPTRKPREAPGGPVPWLQRGGW